MTRRAARWAVAALVLAPLPARGQAADPHPAHAAPAPAPAAPALLDSDTAVMAGMTPRDAMGGPGRPGWQWMGLALGRLGMHDQTGPSGDESFESSNWVMGMGHGRRPPPTRGRSRSPCAWASDASLFRAA